MSEERPRAKKFLGQNFLKDPALIRRLVAAVEAGPEDLVLNTAAAPGP